MVPQIHRDLSWLDFNYRVLQEAKDKSVPLLERLKFLGIYSSNLDEFFKIRVANHRSFLRLGKKTAKDLDYEPIEILTQIQKKVSEQQLEFSEIFENQIIPELKKNGIIISPRKKLTKKQEEFIENYFNEYMLPFVQPVLLQGKKIKPFLNNSALYLAILLKDPESKKTEYAIVKIPSDHLPRFVVLPSKNDKEKEVIFLDDIVRHSLKLLFPGYEIPQSYSIKLTRDGELYIDDEFAGDLVNKIKEGLVKRNIGPASRLVYDRKMPEHLLTFLMEVFDISKYDLLAEGRYHNNSDFFKFPDFGMSHLKDSPMPPTPILEIENSPNIFDLISTQDLFIHPPYHSYESVVKFFEDAAKDVNVTHIKIIQYRVAKVSRIMKALQEAVKNGKQVTAFIEVKARFDEEANIRWGEELENAGVRVKYSLPGFKVHSKMAIVRRIEDGKPKMYAYLGTGNFHEVTAKIYSDIGLFTADTRLTEEATRIFYFLETDQPPTKPFHYMGVGLFNLKEMLLQMIQRETDHAKRGKEASMILKMNSLQDPQMMEALYKASQAGVKIKLIIRGICTLIPGIKGTSDNIEAISIVDKYLEHARIFIFHNGGEEETYFSSADWMERNLHYRIETLVPVFDTEIKKIIRTLINMQLNDNTKARNIGLHLNNQYKQSSSDLAVRAQIESYYFIKRITEQTNRLIKKDI